MNRSRLYIMQDFTYCLAHEDYTLQERIVLIEEPGFLTFSNGGFFLPGTIQNVLKNGGPQKYYRNYCLCQGMVSFNMIDTIGHGIEKVFSEQKRRKCFPPEYTIDNVAKEVSVKVYARDYHDATGSFMTSEKNIERHNNVIKEPFMTSEKDEEHQDNVIKASGKHQENVRKGLTKNQDFILLALHRDPNLTIPELSEIVGIAERNSNNDGHV